MNKREIFLIVILYLFTLYIWFQPINELPFGEVDASAHFSLGDYMAQNDEPISKQLPFYIGKRYNTDNRLAYGHLWYPPQFHVSLSIAQLFGGTRVSSIFFFVAILSTIMVVSSYIVIRNLYGFVPALLSSLLLAFSGRDIVIFLFGLWPLAIAYSLVLVILYCFYKYSSSYLEKKEKKIYLYIMGLLLAVVFFIHPQGWTHSLMALFFFALFLTIKEKRLPFNIKTMLSVLVIFVIFISLFPLQTGNFFYQIFFEKTVGDYVGTPQQPGLSSLFYWFHKPEYSTGFPDFYLSFSQMNGGYWLIPLIFLGAIFLLMRRKRKDLMLLGWMFALYVLMHLDIIGTGRTYKSLANEAHLLYPIAAIGALFLINFISSVKIPSLKKKHLKSALVVVFIILALLFNMPSSYNRLKDGYSGIMRITPYQVEASEWIMENTPENIQLYDYGTVTQSKARWMRMISHRWIGYGTGVDQAMKWTGGSGPNENETYVIFDYSDLALINDKEKIEYLKNIEDNYTGSELIYDENNIKVYEIG